MLIGKIAPLQFLAKRSRRLLAALLIIGSPMLLGSCAMPAITDYASQSPRLDLRQFFSGHVRGWGMVQDRSGKVLRHFVVDIDANWIDLPAGSKTGDGLPAKARGTLDERFVWSDGERQQRVWTITEMTSGKYQGAAGDVVGEAAGQSAGNALNWGYTLRIPYGERTLDVRLDDWMFLIDAATLINRAEMRFFGIRVGEITIAFRRE
jgi:hypothetical protein